MSIVFEAETNIGKKRSVNEDSLWPAGPGAHAYADSPYGQLFIIADGMGGHGAGDVASQVAVKQISTTYYSLGDETADIEARLRTAIHAAHQEIISQASQSPELENMGTTVAAAVVQYDESRGAGQVWIGWAGDSRVYLLRQGRLIQLTRDHSRVWPLIEGGKITWDELRFHPQRSRITNSLSAHRPNTAPDVARFDLEPGDQLLLCSDGLTGEVRPEEIERILMTYGPQQAVQWLIDQANSPKELKHDGQKFRLEGGDDNISTIVIEIPGGQPRSVTEPLPVLDGSLLPPAIAADATVALPAAPPPAAGGSAWLGLALAVTVFALALLGGAAYWLWSAGSTTPVAPVAAVPPTAPIPVETAGQSAVVVVNENTPTLPAEAGPTAAGLAPGETPAPTATRRLLGTATPPPSPTPTPPPPTPTPPPTATAAPTVSIGDIQLLQPNGQVLPNGTRSVPFRWQYGQDCTLPDGYGFLLRLWKEGNPPLGAMDAVTQQGEIHCEQGFHSFTVGDLWTVPGVAGVRSGRFDWDVVVVDLAAPEGDGPAQTYAWFEIGVPTGSDGKNKQ